MLSLTDSTGRSQTINSPCNCRVLIRHLKKGTFAQSGETVLTLIEPDARPMVVAAVKDAELKTLYSGGRIELTFSDGSVDKNGELVTVHLPKAAAGQAIGQASGERWVDVRSSRPISVVEVGQPVGVKIVGYGGKPIDPLTVTEIKPVSANEGIASDGKAGAVSLAQAASGERAVAGAQASAALPVK